MSILAKLAAAANEHRQNRNIELAEEIAATGNAAAVQELVLHLDNTGKAVRHDCIKTLYELGCLRPEMIAGFAPKFLELLSSKDNRMQWGAMTALSGIVQEQHALVFRALDRLQAVAEAGSVITRDHYVNILTGLSHHDSYKNITLPLLKEQLLKAPVNQLPAYAEKSLPVIDAEHKPLFLHTLQTRLPDMEQESKRKRVEKIMKKL